MLDSESEDGDFENEYINIYNHLGESHELKFNFTRKKHTSHMLWMLDITVESGCVYRDKERKDPFLNKPVAFDGKGNPLEPDLYSHIYIQWKKPRDINEIHLQMMRMIRCCSLVYKCLEFTQNGAEVGLFYDATRSEDGQTKAQYSNGQCVSFDFLKQTGSNTNEEKSSPQQQHSRN